MEALTWDDHYFKAREAPLKEKRRRILEVEPLVLQQLQGWKAPTRACLGQMGKSEAGMGLRGGSSSDRGQTGSGRAKGGGDRQEWGPWEVAEGSRGEHSCNRKVGGQWEEGSRRKLETSLYHVKEPGLLHRPKRLSGENEEDEKEGWTSQSGKDEKRRQSSQSREGEKRKQKP
ncbi:hypothetical protein AMTR_s00033p00161210 [Amborella trichopoda]|uniref:Uncharacterized protein n=1 Tax=Amborella trichopoda TaxID=13333 RepID=U5CVW4_AMBTC|nr:hypothetical protein AMTR_s00033p00161210 [Amborella trichopoda]